MCVCHKCWNNDANHIIGGGMNVRYKIINVYIAQYFDRIEELESALNDGYIIERVDSIKLEDGSTLNTYILFKIIYEEGEKGERAN